MIYIFAIHLDSKDIKHENISMVQWENSKTGEKGYSTIIDMIVYINEHPHTVFVKDNKTIVEVFVIDAKPKYLRTSADGRLTNNLLSLPTF